MSASEGAASRDHQEHQQFYNRAENDREVDQRMPANAETATPITLSGFRAANGAR